MNRRGQALTGPLGGSGTVALWGASSLIQSVQQITFTINAATVNTTITAVDTSRSIVSPQGAMSQLGSNNIAVGTVGGLKLTSSTNVQCRRSLAQNYPDLAAATVLEFVPGVIRSIQNALIAQTSASTTATITAVNTAKTFLIVTPDLYSGPGYQSCPRVSLTNGTTLTAVVDTYSASYAPETYIQVVEFF